MNMNKELAKKMGDEVMAAAQQIAKKYGYEVRRGSGRYDSNEYKLNSLTFFKPSDVGGTRFTSSEERKMAFEFDIRKNQLGLSNVNVGDTYFDPMKGCDMTLVGYDTKKRKYPMIVIASDGTSYKMTAGALVNAMKGKR